MKVLVINSFYKPDVGGGAEVTIESIYRPLAAAGVDVVLLATTGSSERRTDLIDGIRVVRIPIANIYWHLKPRKAAGLIRAIWHLLDIYNPWMSRHVREAIRAEQPDIVVCHNLSGWSISACVAAIRTGLPTIAVLHDSYMLCRSALMFRNGQACVQRCVTCRLARLPHRFASNRVNGVVGVSAYMLERFRQEGYFSRAKARTIRNARAIAEERRSQKKIKSNELTFGYIGTIIPAKGVSWLLDQFIRHRITNRLLIAGDGDPEYLKHLKQKGGGLNVEFLGYCDSSSFYAKIDVCVVPSIWPEALGNVAYEACARHMPVIASNRGGLPEIIQDGVNGLLCNPDEPDSLGLAMRRLLDDESLYEMLASNARQSVREMLDPDRVVNAYTTFICEIAANRV
ncbi:MULTISPECIES: glycosyltransferase family 4 protein [unclassified Bradyrhizobium]|uniref:glycosyltransferase family 4 protein n=1 Tax=unclassified Bradyrhizobium TaxID=2631580 RepID=UPI001CD48710|nr:MULTISPECIES: glycosyltransferase family 4 protein [unclassified Bradyrhizobium]